MANDKERSDRARGEKRDEQVIRAVEFGLSDAVQGQSMELLGFSVKIEEWECLMTLRVWSDGQRLVGFVGSDSLANCLVKAQHAIERNKVQWKEDKYR